MTDMPPPAAAPTRLVLRHRWPVRLMHWINVLALTILFMSGLQIFMAHPALSWGTQSRFGHEALEVGAVRGADGTLRGVTRVGRHRFDTTGWMGAAPGPDGTLEARAFPAWATVPGPRWLAMGRRWHFFFAWVFVLNGLCFVGYAAASGHLRRDLWPDRRDWRGLGRALLDHLRFRHPRGAAALRYNVLQKLAYLLAIFVFGGGIVLMGLAMSPRMDAVLGPLLDLVGGRQSARTLHFILAWCFVAFVLVHVFMVLVTGPLNQLRGMLTGRYRIETASTDESEPDHD